MTSEANPGLPLQMTVTASKTFALPADELFAALSDEAARDRWLAGAEVRLRDGAVRRRPPRGAVVAHVTTRGPGRSVLTVAHGRLPDDETAACTRRWWRDRLATVKLLLEDG
jgi:hypothetical protein